MAILQALNLALRFLLELCVLAALGYWGFQSQGLLGKIVFGIGTPLVAAMVWGMFVAPKATYRLPKSVILGIELLVFGAGVAALYAAQQPTLALVLGLLYALNRLLIYIWQQ